MADALDLCKCQHSCVRNKDFRNFRNFRTYALLSRWSFPKSYLGKIMLVVFLGAQAPLLALVLYLFFLFSSAGSPSLDDPGVFALLVISALAGTAVMLWALHGLLAPVRLTAHCVKEYLDSGEQPQLPIRFTDEAGRLMADVHYAIEHLDSTLRMLEGLSGTDHLTGLLNRREGEKRLAQDLARVQRGGSVLTLAVVDINRFKQINDTHGHRVGDVCIRHAAETIRRNIREGDWLARWGGDEFLLALHDASPFAPTEVVLNRIVKDLKSHPVRVPKGEELILSVTVGATRCSGSDLEDSFAKADEAMYEAKREGRHWILAV